MCLLYSVPEFWVVAYFFAMSVVTHLQFFFDKSAAINGRWRVAEANLLFVALIGGAVGAKAAQNSLRHKTRNERFRWLLNLTRAVNVATFGLLMTQPAREALAAGLDRFIV